MGITQRKKSEIRLEKNVVYFNLKTSKTLTRHVKAEFFTFDIVESKFNH